MIYIFVEEREAEEPALALLHSRDQTESSFRLKCFIVYSEIAAGLPRIEQWLETVDGRPSLNAAIHAGLLPPGPDILPVESRLGQPSLILQPSPTLFAVVTTSVKLPLRTPIWPTLNDRRGAEHFASRKVRS